MLRLFTACAFVLAIFLAASPATAQSLAAIAEKAPKHNGAAVKTYTNADLDAVPTLPAKAPALAESEAAPAEEPATPLPRQTIEEIPGEGQVNVVTKVEKNSSAENEPFWRRVTKSVKDRIATAEAELAMIAGRLDSAGPGDREKLTALQSKRQKDLEFLNAEYAGHVK